MKNILKPLAKSVLISLRLTKVASAEDTGIIKQILASRATTLIFSNEEEMDDLIKIIKSLEKPGLLIKLVSKTTKNIAEKQKKWIS